MESAEAKTTFGDDKPKKAANQKNNASARLGKGVRMIQKQQPRPTNDKPEAVKNNTKAPSPLDSKISTQLDLMVKAHQFAEENFDAKIIKHADWTLIRLLLKNDSQGRATVVKHIIEASKCSAGTVRQMFNRFEKNGYIVVEQKVGRSELYRPTQKLKKFVSKWSLAIFS